MPAAGVDPAQVSGQVEFQLNDWRAQLRASQTATWKQAIYAVTRPGIDLLARRGLSPEALRRWKPDWVTYARGFPFEYRVRWGLAGVDMRQAIVLVQGAGTGWEIPFYAQLRPARIIATDLFSFETWQEVSEYCQKSFGVPVEFRQIALEEHGFLDNASVDVCISHGVLEHCRDVPAVLRESRRVLRRGGRLFAEFGPLWYGASGDHFCSRAGLENVYAHVALDADDYRAFYQAHLTENEDFQSGGRYVELDLFSKLSTDQYLREFAAAGFERTGLIVYLQKMAFQFERAYPERWAALVERLRGQADADELRMSGLIVRMVAK